MSQPFTDDKTPLVTPFILSLLAAHPPSPPRPLVIGLNGLQGIGKTTLVTSLARSLPADHHRTTLVLSIDDFYLPHDRQLALAASHPTNLLVQTRGEPGTHDLALANRVFASLLAGEETRIPQYDKAAFSGRGDRLSESEWPIVNRPGEPRVEVVILEGWCVGFRALEHADLEAKWRGESLTLRMHPLEHLELINDFLRGYDALTDLLDGFVHIDAEDLAYVYAWRGEQEAALRRERGTGMSEEEVVRFVDGYFPAYELYCDGVRKGVLRAKGEGRQLKIVVGRDRRVKESCTI
ncbi:related to ATP-binding protein, putative pantothenate kinase [Cephalotrichum gorgonifer]|uniref:Related to ATP-binding protein, putative pantothenate kinase n=1 Tax=Cephalotrichum gorgonifer TaxID=2041049 RepID=A0AAE8MT74_9PEZI|nr:related to ATP-binding protein, putative pantothenate kinase [Cephalotrichum gorgonifer]